MSTQQQQPDMKKYFPLIVLGVVVLILLAFGGKVIVKLEPTERGVVFRPFSTEGLDKEEVYGPGYELIAPWNDIYVYSLQEQKSEEPMDVLDKNGLSVNIDITVRFMPMETKIGYIYEIFRLDYANTLVIPEVRSTVRQVAGRYTAEEIYSTKRAEVEAAIIEEAGKKLGENFIMMKALLIRSINLPKDIKQAIETKLTQEQEFLAYKFKIDKEKAEAERKKIAAEGEAMANKIINSSLTDELLKMRGIEATLELSKSPNSKTVVIGSGKDGMPLILGNN